MSKNDAIVLLTNSNLKDKNGDTIKLGKVYITPFTDNSE